MEEKKTVLVFGTFDGLHDGHRFFLREARKLGGQLVAAVAQETVVKTLKGRTPREPLSKRLAGLRSSGLVGEVVVGDETLGSWSAIKKYSPDTVALGYDQDALAEALADFIQKENLPITLVRLPAHQPNTYHSILL